VANQGCGRDEKKAGELLSAAAGVSEKKVLVNGQKNGESLRVSPATAGLHGLHVSNGKSGRGRSSENGYALDLGCHLGKDKPLPLVRI